jgi:hypothetical protein
VIPLVDGHHQEAGLEHLAQLQAGVGAGRCVSMKVESQWYR